MKRIVAGAAVERVLRLAPKVFQHQCRLSGDDVADLDRLAAAPVPDFVAYKDLKPIVAALKDI